MTPTTKIKQKLFNLEQWNSHSELIDGIEKRVERKVKTILYNVPYAMAKGIMNKALNSPAMPGTFYKIPENI